MQKCTNAQMARFKAFLAFPSIHLAFIRAFVHSCIRASVHFDDPQRRPLPLLFHQVFRVDWTRVAGFFMVDPTQADAEVAAARAIDRDGLRTMCLFPAMQRYSVHDDRARRLFEVAAARPGTAVFVHCGVLSVGVRKKLGLASPFDVRFGNPLDLHAVASSYPSLPIIVPHFGAGLLREALMVADLCSNVLFDTSNSNGWIKYTPGLTLAAVFRQAL